TQCMTAFKTSGGGSVMQVPAGASIAVPGLWSGATILAENNVPLGGGLLIEQLLLSNPVAMGTVPCSVGTCNQITATLFMIAKVTVATGPSAGATERRQRWLVTFLTNPSDGDRIVSCVGALGSQNNVTGGGTSGRLPIWLSNSGLLGDSAFTQSTPGLLGFVGIGTTTPGTGTFSPAKLHIGDNGRGTMAVETANATAADGASVIGYRAKGTLAAKATLANGDKLFEMAAVGYDGTGYRTGGSIRFGLDGTPGAADMPGNIMMNVAEDGTTNLADPTFILRNNGRIGIATNTPGNFALDVNGDANAQTEFYIGNSSKCTPAGCQILSDERVKQNVGPIDDALGRILRLRGVSFKWNEPRKYGKGRKIGLIAQEVKKEFPEAVSEYPEGWMLRYDRLVAPLIEAVKALHAALTADDGRLASLEAENAALMSELALLERSLK
ncbi:MAG TPA: tail fiber domain-containing protein, partial [Bdellovibrionota bacterium]|nr:tail fiber domain-containing protein [Bdellovibrionota bacterium]